MKRLTAAQVLRRMQAGDLPRSTGNSGTLVFDDGARVSPALSIKLRKSGQIVRPTTNSIHAKWQLQTPKASK